MDKETLWKVYVEKFPSFEGEGTVTLSRKGLRKFFDETYRHAHVEGQRQGLWDAQARKTRKKPSDSAAPGSAFEQMFGKGFF